MAVPEEWKLITVAENEVMGDVELRKRTAVVWIERINRVTEPGRVVHRLGPGVCAQEAEVSNLFFEAGLQ